MTHANILTYRQIRVKMFELQLMRHDVSETGL